MHYKTICNERPVCAFCTRSEAVLCAIPEPLIYFYVCAKIAELSVKLTVGNGFVQLDD